MLHSYTPHLAHIDAQLEAQILLYVRTKSQRKKGIHRNDVPPCVHTPRWLFCSIPLPLYPSVSSCMHAVDCEAFAKSLGVCAFVWIFTVHCWNRM